MPFSSCNGRSLSETTHRSLHKDAPISRPIHQTGIIRSHPILGVLHHHYVRVSVFGTHRSSLVIIRRISHSQTAPPRAVCLIRGIISVWIKQTSCPNVKLFQCGCYRFIMCPFRTSSSRCFSIFSGSSSSSRVSSDRALSSTRSSSSSFACKARVSRRFAL